MLNTKTEAWTFDNSDDYLLIDTINITSIATSGGVLVERKSHCKFFQEHSASQSTLNEWRNKVREKNCTILAGPTDPETTHVGGVGAICHEAIKMIPYVPSGTEYDDAFKLGRLM